jgi:YVTN family beta-propeller protein
MRQVSQFITAVLIAFLSVVLATVAQTTPQRTLLALSKHDHTLAMVDAVALKVIARLPVGPDPHEVIASPDGTKAYVSIYGFGRYHTLSVLDLIAQKALPDIDTGALNGPHGLAVAGGKIWFTAEGAKAVARFNPTSNSVDRIMGTGQNRTHMLYVTGDEKKIYTTNVTSGTVSVLEAGVVAETGSPADRATGQRTPPSATPQGMDWNQTLIAVGRGDEGFDISPDGRELWTANAQDGTLSVIDLASKQVVATVDAKIPASNRLKFTPDGKLVFITSLRGGDVVIYDVGSRKEYKRVAVGHGSAGILMDPVKGRVFVACTPDNYVAIVDLKTFAVTGHIDVGGQPDGLAWAVRP